MRRTVFTCDHCGKELDEMQDYTEMEIRDFVDYIETDLCVKCYDELNNIVLQYCNKKAGYKNEVLRGTLCQKLH